VDCSELMTVHHIALIRDRPQVSYQWYPIVTLGKALKPIGRLSHF